MCRSVAVLGGWGRDMTLGKNIRRVRKAAKLNQTQLAGKCDVGRGYIWHLEVGDREPSMRMLRRIAKACGVKAKDLLP